jgi:hypothetical protein
VRVPISQLEAALAFLRAKGATEIAIRTDDWLSARSMALGTMEHGVIVILNGEATYHAPMEMLALETP